MSSSQDSRGRGGGSGALGSDSHSGNENRVEQQQQFRPDFRAGNNAAQHPPPPTEAFYYNTTQLPAGYSPFSGDIRDSIAAIWSRTSPNGGGEGVAAFSAGHGYGQFAAAAAAAAGPDNSSTAGQFAANLTGHFATSELGMFGGAGNDYYQQYGYGPQYTQWPESGGSATRPGYSSYMDEPRGSRDRVSEVQQGLESMKLKKNENGYPQGASGAPKKMSWASVASQPAKPQPAPTKAKKPGVLAPPTIIPSSKPPPAPTAPPPVPLPVPNGVPPDMMKEGPPPPPPMAMPPPLHPYMSMPPHPVVPFHGPPPPRTARVANGTAMALPPENNNPDEPPRHPVLESLKSCNNYNPKTFDLNPNNARFFVIKSFSEDDIHRSIKYEIWCSTEHGNKRLDAAFRERIGPIFLLFSVNGSGHFCGMAEMLSPVDYSNTSSSVWVQDKFKGQFKVKWIYVKDVPNLQLRHIRLENNENKPVTNSRDTQEVPPDKGKAVLKIIHSFNHMTSILDDFVYYEKRQKEEEGKKAAAHIPGRSNDHHRGGHRDHYHHREKHDEGGHPRPRGKPRNM